MKYSEYAQQVRLKTNPKDEERVHGLLGRIYIALANERWLRDKKRTALADEMKRVCWEAENEIHRLTGVSGEVVYDERK